MLHPVHAPATLAPAWIALPPWALSDCIVAAVGRSTVGLSLAPEQRLNHYPTSPYVSLGAIFQGHIEMVYDPEAEPCGPNWRSTSLSLAGPQTVPRTTQSSEQCHGLMVLFYPEAWQALTGMKAGDWTDRWAAPDLPRPVRQACAGLWQGHDDEARLAQFFAQLTPLWQRCRSVHRPFERQIADTMHTWTQAVALRAAQTHIGRSLRQAERRLKSWTGSSLRSLRKRTRAEQAFFAALDAMASNTLQWGELATECGYADQSHLIRAVREVTGFSPQLLQEGLWTQESFWVYRAWAQLRGLNVTPPTSN